LCSCFAIAAIILTTTAAVWPCQSRRGLLQVAPDYMKPVRYDAGKLRGLLRPQQMTSYDDNSRPVPEYLLVTHARHGQFKNFAA
jgi:hypothetical protein